MNSVVCYPPLRRWKKPGNVELSVFLAGTIEMGNSHDWQQEMIDTIQDRASVIYNPRRAEWDASWVQSIHAVPFNNQVNWELDFIEAADRVYMFLDPASKSVISMLELGFLAAYAPDKLWVCCPDGFWRKGNVEIVCNRYGIKLYESFNVFKNAARLDLERAYDNFKIKKVTDEER
jgi:hypothetical protein